MSTTLQQVADGQANPEVPINENFETLSHTGVYGKRHAATSGLTWGYYGGRWGGFAVADGTLSLTATETNYVVVENATGAISVAITATNWNDTGDYSRVYKIVTGASGVTSVEDHRAGPGGIGGGGGGSGSGTSDIGRHAMPIPAGAWRPSVTNGAAALASVAVGAGVPDLITVNFSNSVEQYAQIALPMPKSWDEGTLTAKFYWSHPTAATNFGVVWGIQAVAFANADGMATTFGTPVTVADAGGSGDTLYVSNETAAFTVAGSPSAEDLVCFRIYRNVANGSDDLAVDARLHAVVIYLNTDAATDA